LRSWWHRFFILHSAFDILHFGFRGTSDTEMKNVECRMKNEEGEAAVIPLPLRGIGMTSRLGWHSAFDILH